MAWVWESSRSEGIARLVLLAIADAASDDGGDAWPSVHTLASKAKVGERTVQRAVRRLVELGELEVRSNAGKHGVNVYRILMGRQSDTPVNLTPPSDSHPRQSDGASMSTQRGVTVTPEPSLTIHKKNSLGATKRRTQPRPPDPIWDALVAACRIDTTQLTTTNRGAVNKAVAELRGVGADPAQISARAQTYRRTYPNAALTPSALVKHWGQLNGNRQPSAPYHQEWPT
jgi:hypothetical protein